jgi:4-amino-4-deoxy-L-arabinose transferase-like glycosyltransferase
LTRDRWLLDGPKDDRRSLLLLLLAATVLFGAGIGLRDPWPADEPRFALVARQMVESGSWLFPMRGGELYPDKPPLFMWAIAAFLKLTGSLRFAFLLPSLLAGLGTVALVFDLARRLHDRATAWRAGLLLVLTVQFTLQARTAQIDALVTFLVTLGVYGFLRFLLLEGGWRWYALGWFAAGLGVITKGVGILALFVLVPAIYTHRAELRRARFGDWLKGLSGPLVFLGAIALWAVPMLVAVERSGDPALAAYRDEILFRQTLTRYGAAWHHVAPWWDYLVNTVPAFWLPLSALLPWLVPAFWREARKGDRRTVLLLGTLVLVLVFFSASPGKRGVYITPATPALALLAAPLLPALLQARWPRRVFAGLAGLLAAVAVLATAALLLVPKVAHALELRDLPNPWPAALALAVVSAALFALFRRSPFCALASVFGAAWLVVGFGVNPMLNDSRTPETILNTAESRRPAGEPMLIVAYREQFLLHARRPLSHLPYRLPPDEQAHAAAHWQKAGTDRWVLGPEAVLAPHFDLSRGVDLGVRHRQHWLLLPPGSARPLPPDPREPVYSYAPHGWRGP